MAGQTEFGLQPFQDLFAFLSWGFPASPKIPRDKDVERRSEERVREETE
jgi:hypothetical protein